MPFLIPNEAFHHVFDAVGGSQSGVGVFRPSALTEEFLASECLGVAIEESGPFSLE